jgi:vacuolar-type H+-ATPase subunit I/STV1
MGMGE